MDTQCKKWRLRADAINDLAIFIELLLSIPYVRQFSLVVLSFSSCAKSIVGVAGGATRAALTQHQVFFFIELYIKIVKEKNPHLTLFI